MSAFFDLAIVGAGPAGMAAAVEATDLGLTVAMLDEQATPGGQVLRGVERKGSARGERWGPPLVRRFRDSTVTYLPNTAVWGRDGDSLLYSMLGRTERLIARTIMIATGSMERPALIAGHTWPGVFTIGGLQALLKGSGTIPAGRVVLIGSGPLLLLAAAQLAEAGAAITAILDTKPRSRWRNAIPHAGAFLSYPVLGLRGAGLIGDLWRRRIPVHRAVRDVRIDGEGSVKGVTFTAQGMFHELDADVVGLHDGVVPNDHLAIAIGCATRWDPRIRSFCPVTDETCRSSIPGIWIAGDAATISGGFVASLEGRLAALDIAAGFGRINHGEQRARSASLAAHRQRIRRARRFLDELYAPTLATFEADDAALLCRCEEVSVGDMRRAIAMGANSVRKLKAATRCGMGPCQGRQCTLSALNLLASNVGVDVAALQRPTLRMPSRPISVAELAECDTGQDAMASDA
jgi:NADPH-dependent 2,4-dienoyl-CoA reductase/sulfur reductase-like enzyme